jgi:hypothetical protein
VWAACKARVGCVQGACGLRARRVWAACKARVGSVQGACGLRARHVWAAARRVWAACKARVGCVHGACGLRARRVWAACQARVGCVPGACGLRARRVLGSDSLSVHGMYVCNSVPVLSRASVQAQMHLQHVVVHAWFFETCANKNPGKVVLVALRPFDANMLIHRKE